MKDQSSQAVRYHFLLSSVAIALAAIVLCRLFLLDGYSPSDVIATHWNRAGQVDGAGRVSELLFALSVMAGAPAVVAIALVVLGVPLQGRSMLLSGVIGLTTFLGSVATCVSWSVATLNQEAIRWQEASPMRGVHVAIVIALPSFLGSGAAFMARYLWRVPDRAASFDPSLSLAPGERVMWLGRASSSAWLWIGLPLSLSATLAWAAVEGRASPVALLLLSVAVLLADAFSMLRVTVDRRGLSVRYGHLGLIRQLIPLAKVDGARALDIRPMDHGGWGYRGSLFLLGKAAVVVRRGEGLEVMLREGRQFLVTVDDAGTGAALLNGLVRQQSKTENGEERTALGTD